MSEQEYYWNVGDHVIAVEDQSADDRKGGEIKVPAGTIGVITEIERDLGMHFVDWSNGGFSYFFNDVEELEVFKAQGQILTLILDQDRTGEIAQEPTTESFAGMRQSLDLGHVYHYENGKRDFSTLYREVDYYVVHRFEFVNGKKRRLQTDSSKALENIMPEVLKIAPLDLWKRSE